MDIKSELEVKFDAQNLPVSDFLSFIGERYGEGVLKYKTVSGTDNYYIQGENKIRHRCDGTRKTSVLTWKKRKSADSITDRHEIDMPIDPSLRGGTLVDDFLEATGWKHEFGIFKTSFIFHVRNVDGIVLCIALYDVWSLPRQVSIDDGRRFLEIEVEKDNDCSLEMAESALAGAKMEFQFHFDLADPLNQSLAEIYGPPKT